MEELVKEVTTNVALATVALVGAYLAMLLRKARLWLAERERAEKFGAALDQLERVAAKTVRKIEEVTARELRKAVYAGRADRTELVCLAREAYQEVVDVMGPEYMEVLRQGIGDVETYLLNTIEEKVEAVKYLPGPLYFEDGDDGDEKTPE